MTAPTLFDPSICDEPTYVIAPEYAGLRVPAARTTDPLTSHEAGAQARKGEDALQAAIRNRLGVKGPGTAWEIATWVIELNGDRWQESTIRSACAPARSHLVRLAGVRGWSPGGASVCVYALGEWQRLETVKVRNGAL